MCLELCLGSKHDFYSVILLYANLGNIPFFVVLMIVKDKRNALPC